MATVSYTLSDPAGLADVRAWLADAENIGFADDATVKISFQAITVSGYLGEA